MTASRRRFTQEFKDELCREVINTSKPIKDVATAYGVGPETLPRYLPVDTDRRLTRVLTKSPGNELASAALRLQRSCGLRIGELLDLELDCVHEVPGHGNWLKVLSANWTPSGWSPSMKRSWS